MTRLLILGGTAEAAGLAATCVARPGLRVITSLAGRTRMPHLPPGEVRIGGFGGPAGLAEYLRAQAIDRLIDATHPFATQIGAHAAAACTECGVPRLRLLRPPWQPVAGDHWIDVADAEDAVRHIPELGRRVFVTLGQSDLAAFAGRDDLWLLVRTIEPQSQSTLANALWITGRGPFRVDDELALMRAHEIDVLLTKASGGQATYAKIAAARELGLPVLMIRRPAPPPGPVVPTVTDALAWLAQLDQPRRGRSAW